MADDCVENEEQRPVAAAGSSYMLVSVEHRLSCVVEYAFKYWITIYSNTS